LEEREIVYRCDCSRERTLRAILSLGRDELAALAAKGESTEVCCHFCGGRYLFPPDELKALLGTD
ncbi:MAG TPA: Hsp33 family molecular chaperone HslO, partial [Candidatus Cryptobacteroides sp.]|nr:Hsp33 family molecular chaperone HslO [Candidatus Cryptobacteroides sp.]